MVGIRILSRISVDKIVGKIQRSSVYCGWEKLTLISKVFSRTVVEQSLECRVENASPMLHKLSKRDNSTPELQQIVVEMSQVLIRIFYGIESKPVQMTLQGSSLGSFLYKQDGTIYVTEKRWSKDKFSWCCVVR